MKSLEITKVTTISAMVFHILFPSIFLSVHQRIPWKIKPSDSNKCQPFMYWVSDLSRITYPKVVSIMRGLWGKLYHTRLKAHFIITNWGVAFGFCKLWLATFELCLSIFHADFIALWALLMFHIYVYKLWIHPNVCSAVSLACCMD